MICSFFKAADCLAALAELDAELKALEAAGTLKAPAAGILLTLAALFILQEKFEDSEDEWTLIAKKAKSYLKQAGLQKPDIMMAKINLEVK